MIKREFLIFLIVGCLTVVIDFLSYRIFLFFNILNINSAKACSFILGTVFSYFANKLWTFSHNHVSSNNLIRFIFVYTLTLAINTITNKFFLNYFGVKIWCAFLIATFISAMLNFIGMKFFVFKNTSFHKGF